MNSGQLELALDDVRVPVARVPWSGSSPRDLTRARLALFLEQSGKKSMRDLLQYDLFADLSMLAERAPEEYSGAPSLLPF